MKDYTNKFYDLINEKFEEYVSKRRYCCFARQRGNQEHPLKSKLLWSHYSDGLRGFVIEYDLEHLLNSLSNFSGENVGHGSMRYQNLKSYNFLSDYVYPSKGDPDVAYSLFVNRLTTKSPEWEYEQEFRLFHEGKSINHFHPEAFKRIIIGEKMSPYKEKTLLSIVREIYPKAIIADAKVCKETFEIVVENRKSV
ncbi:DUF2971 domain-containing protein [Vibrio sp. WXL210]|uniref:DUF2971 domain-containing protein n=1 Tax=Vibrio sp. WXL210 TaxID=3450709 RepID=UPI003EC80A99